MLSDPSKVGALAPKVALNRIHQHGEGGFVVKAAGFFEGEDSLHPAIAFVTGGAMAALAPHDTVTQCPLGSVVGGLDALYLQKHPQRSHLPFKTSGKSASLPCSVNILGDQVAEAGIKGSPLTDRRWSMGHLAQPPQLGACPAAKVSDVRLFAFLQSFGRSDQVRQRCLPQVKPVLVNPETIADQDARPVLDERLEDLFGSAAMHDEEGHRGIHHHPKPPQRTALPPGSLINVVDFGLPGHLPNSLIVRSDGLGDPVDHLLDGPLADGQPRHRAAKLRDDGSTVSLNAPQFSNEGAKPWSIARLVGRGKLRLVEPATAHTATLVQHQMGDLHEPFYNTRKTPYKQKIVPE
jgi:hypothetical protein